MTGAVLDRPGAPDAPDAPLGPDALLAPGAEAAEGGRGTLEDLLGRVLHETRTNGSAECPVCHASLTLTRAHAHATAECGGCGSRLS